MRITSIYDLKNNFKDTKKIVQESLINDIIKLAEAKDIYETDNFYIKIKVEEISKYK